MHSSVRIVAHRGRLGRPAHPTPVSALEVAPGDMGPDATDINPSRRSEP
jgi:hypothetical protein